MSVKSLGFSNRLWCAGECLKTGTDLSYLPVSGCKSPSHGWFPATKMLATCSQNSWKFNSQLLGAAHHCEEDSQSVILRGAGLRQKGQRRTHCVGSIPGYGEKSVWTSENCGRLTSNVWPNSEIGFVPIYQDVWQFSWGLLPEVIVSWCL